jgi:hypothetical protein
MIELTALRELTLSAASSPGRHPYLSAASGLVKVGAFFYVVADDEYHLGAFPVAGDGPGELIRLFAGTLPTEAAARKKSKPDLEALAYLPAFGGFPGGALLCIPSGSTAKRHGGALLGLDSGGIAIGAPRPIDLSSVYAGLLRDIPALNIEGAAVVGDELLLLQRGNHRHSRNACIRFNLQDVLRVLGRTGSLDIGPSTITPVDLGDIDGVPLCFSDVAPLPGIGCVFTAIAEDTDDSYIDGPCRGAAIGIMDTDYRVRYLEQLTDPAKVEGVHAEIAGQLLQVWLVTDADDADTPARLLTADICID